MSDDGCFEYAAAGLGLLTLVGMGVIIFVPSKDETERKKRELAEADSIAKYRVLDSISNAMVAASAKNTYRLDSIELDNMKKVENLHKVLNGQAVTPIATSAVAPIVYRGVEVDSLQTFNNAKLVGVDNHNIEYYINGAISTYFAKDLLFELNNSKMVSLVSPANPFFVGHRYDLSYFPFKKNVVVKEKDLLRICLDGQSGTIVLDKTVQNYDGIIVNYGLSTKSK